MADRDNPLEPFRQALAGATRARTKWLITVVVLAIAVLSLVLGINQERFLTCEDFTISGNALPEDCVPAPD